MKKIGIVADAASDLPQKIIEKYNIGIVNFKIDFGPMSEFKGNAYEKIKEAEKRGIESFVRTSQPSIQDFLSVFKEKLKEFEELICVTITSKLSGTYNSAMQAKKFLGPDLENKVEIVDSLTGSGAEGLVVLKAVDLVEKKEKLSQIAQTLQKATENIKLVAMLENHKWLQKSGRLPKIIPMGLQQMQKAKIRPLFTVKDGKIKIVGLKTKVESLSSTIFEDFKKRVEDKKVKACITHADTLKEAENLKSLIEKNLKNVEISFVNLITPILGGQLGPGTLLLSWDENK